MAGNTNTAKKLTLVPLILMIFTSVFGFANMPRGFYLMGYAAIPWYILSALVFFIPYAFMMAEYGAAYKNETGGMYSWMEKSVGGKYAFVGTFMWYASYIIWMVNVASSIWIPLSNFIFGEDRTGTWSLLGLGSTQTLGILGALWILLVTFIASKGVEKITKVTSVGGTAILALNFVLLIGGIFVLIANGGQFAEPIVDVAKSFTQSPNPAYQTSLTVLSFLVFAIFAFGGLEVLGGLVDQTENAETTFPKGLSIAAIVISIGYAVGIFACGMFTNWNTVLSSENVHMGNVAYVVIQNLGYQIGQALNLSQTVSITMGAWFARFVGLSMFFALSGAFFTLAYSPLKTLIQGSPKEVWPGRLGEIKDGMPLFAMKVQAIIVIVMILAISFGGGAAAEFFSILVLMTNVAMTLPYMFLSAAFPAFKKKQLAGEVDKPFMVYKSHGIAMVAAIIVTVFVGFANVFTIIEPAIGGAVFKTVMMIVGPLAFGVIAFILYTVYERKYLDNKK
ncbi:MAG: glutamate/gamma-aminobutyrate family transporter YjeM [Romboutsia sp.]|uniref:glutamate/gamma-aminobutyrate family transporter YjeM n=1 Tax=Romboutsia sp. TaxID=1965302 RepID=UPI003F33DD15